MKVGAIDTHHRELQTNMSQDTVMSHMRHLLTKFRVFRHAASNREFTINGACTTQSCVMIDRLEAPGDADLVHHVSFLQWSLNSR